MLDIAVANPAVAGGAPVEVEVEVAIQLVSCTLVRHIEVALAGHALPMLIPFKKLLLVKGGERAL